ncbi:Cof-type HAD-IIB family hydrolase [Erysipelothrix sp. Poltava]|nr:Cof-type HAD-IIB family hydrolase [Erysipelothrix sp. Poltava]
MIQVFASDYDGTLFRNSKVSQKDLEAIKAFQRRGHKFGIVTGRTMHSICAEIDKYGIPVDFIVGINGGVVLSYDHQELFLSNLNQNVVDSLIVDIEAFGVLFYGVNDGYRLSRVVMDASIQPVKPNIPLTDLSDLKHERGVQAMYVVTQSQDKALALTHDINEKYGDRGVVAYQNVSAVDIGMRGISKATGLQEILDFYHFEGPVYTMGDSYNDLPMIDAFCGFVVSDGESSLKAMAQAVFPSVGDAICSLLDKK